jgi:hypothetical protein
MPGSDIYQILLIQIIRAEAEAGSGPDAAAKKHQSNLFDGLDWRIDRMTQL